MKEYAFQSDRAIDAALLLANYKEALDAHSIVAITDRRGNITYVNAAFCRISQYSRDELIGNDHRIINSRFHEQDFFAHLWKTITSGQQWRGDIRNRAKDGSYYWVQTTIIPFIDQKEKIFQFVAVRTDISDKVLAAKKLRRGNQRLRTLSEALRSEKKNLHAKNLALNELISHIENDKELVKATIARNVETIIMPLLATLKASSRGQDAKLIEVISKSLREMGEVFFPANQVVSARLTPRELMICSMVKNGLSVKEMADQLHVSPRTGEKHRENIREKLGLRAQKLNLASYLLQQA